MRDRPGQEVGQPDPEAVTQGEFMSIRGRLPGTVLLPLLLVGACSSSPPAPAVGSGTSVPSAPSGAPSPSGAAAPSGTPATSGTSGASGAGAGTTAATAVGGGSGSPGPGAAASVPLSNDAAGAVAAAHPNGTATCTALSAARAGAILGAATGAGVRDRRTAEATRTQLDGCSYTTGGGVHLAYLVWKIPTAGTKATVEDAVPTARMGARTFSPGIGTFSAGAVLVTGPVAVAQVNAVRSGRLAQVSVTAPDARRATDLATAAARALIGG